MSLKLLMRLRPGYVSLRPSETEVPDNTNGTPAGCVEAQVAHGMSLPLDARKVEAQLQMADRTPPAMIYAR